MTSKHNKTVLLHTNDFRECWKGKFFLPGAKKPFTGTVEVSSDTNPFHLNRRLTQRLNYKGGKNHGVCESFYESGKVSERRHYKNNDQLYGVREWFYKNGQLKKRQHYKNGKCHGVSEEFYKNGRLSLRQHYRYGLPQS